MPVFCSRLSKVVDSFSGVQWISRSENKNGEVLPRNFLISCFSDVANIFIRMLHPFLILATDILNLSLPFFSFHVRSDPRNKKAFFVALC